MRLNTPQIMLDDTEVFRAAIEDEMNRAFIEWFDNEIDKEILGQPLASGCELRGLIEAMSEQTEQTIFGFPIVETDAVAEGEILCGSFPPPERDNMTLEEYAEQCAKYFTKIKLKKIDCWLCGGSSTVTCNCHNHPPGKPAAPCNITCRA